MSVKQRMVSGGARFRLVSQEGVREAGKGEAGCGRMSGKDGRGKKRGMYGSGAEVGRGVALRSGRED